jgi:hypothetical protein
MFEFFSNIQTIDNDEITRYPRHVIPKMINYPGESGLGA